MKTKGPMKRRHLTASALFLLLGLAVAGSAQEIGEAIEKGDLAIIKEIVEKSPGIVNAKDKTGRTPLHWACRNVHFKVVEYLVENGADVNAKDDNAITPLHSLSYRGESKAMELLIKKGANLEAKDGDGLVPLLYAVFSGHEIAAAVLIKNGADVNARDHSGRTPADIAMDQGHTRLSRYLISKGGELTPVSDPEVTELRKDIYKITFCYQQCTNILVYLGSKEILVIDTGYRRTAEKLKMAINNIGQGRSIRIINTHQHRDHFGGNDMVTDKKNIVSHANLAQMVSRRVIRTGKGPLKGASGRKYDPYYSMPFNNREVWLIPMPGIHTDDDMIVFLVDSRIVHMGDLLISQSFPSLTRTFNVVGYLEILDKVTDIFDDKTVFVGGHGRNLSRMELIEYKNMLQETIAIVTAGMKEGKSAQKMWEDGVLRNYTSYDTFIPELGTRYWIGAVCRNYAGGV